MQKHPVDDDIPPPVKPVDEKLHFEHIENGESNKALSSKWTTGVAPKIGYVREFPSKHQLQAHEELNSTPKANNGTFEGKTIIPSLRASSEILLSHRLENMELI